MKKQQTILFFCAKFNPPTHSHISLIKKTIKKIKPDKIFIAIIKCEIKNNCEVFPPFFYHKQMIKNLFTENKIKVDLCDFLENFVKYINDYVNDNVYLLIDNDKYKQLLKKWKIAKFKKFIKTILCCCKEKSKKNFTNFNKKIFGKMNVNYIKKNHLYLEYAITNKLPKPRYLHTLRVLNTATEIGYGNNFNDKEILQLQIAATLHDIGKTYSDNQISKILSKKQLKHFPTIHCAHGLIGAKIAKKQYKINDEIILKAIANHVICNDDNKVTKALFCADKLEPARTKKDIPNRSQLLHKCISNDLNNIFQKVLKLNKEKY